MSNKRNSIKNVERGYCKDCFQQWSLWGEWTQCDRMCGALGMNRTRHCSGYGQPCKCLETIDGKECEVQWKPCDDQNRMLHCDTINGSWSQWGGYSSCSVTCGYGIMFVLFFKILNENLHFFYHLGHVKDCAMIQNHKVEAFNAKVVILIMSHVLLQRFVQLMVLGVIGVLGFVLLLVEKVEYFESFHW